MRNATQDVGRKSPSHCAFKKLWTTASDAPLTEILPAAPGDSPAALGFALAWAAAARADGPIVWAMPDVSLAEDGEPNVEGLAQFGLTPDRLVLVRTRTQADALWATEQALKLNSALALCVMAPTKKSLSLTATRRLLLNAEAHKTRCVLLRLDGGGASAAWTRWRISAAPSQGAGRELGPPRFAAELERNRSGPSNLSWTLNWSAHEYALNPNGAMDGAVAAAPADRPATPRHIRAA